MLKPKEFQEDLKGVLLLSPTLTLRIKENVAINISLENIYIGFNVGQGSYVNKGNFGVKL